MLSIAAMGAGSGEYYLKLAQEDYYLEGGEPPGRWLGKGARFLGLEGTVNKATFRNLFDGRSPDGTAQLVQRQGDRSRQPGWDLTFSAPKSVSVLWAVADAETQAKIQAAHFEAVQAAMDFLQDTAAFTRRGRGGARHEPTALVAATFEHGTSRAQDPQLHTHTLVMNMGVRADGTTGTIRSQSLYQAKMAAGALYRTQLAYRLKNELGVMLTREQSWFELRGVSKRARDDFSTRAREIREAAAESGWSSPRVKEMLCLATRSVKDHIARGELASRWRERASQLDFGAKHVQRLLHRATPLTPFQTQNLLSAVLPASVQHLTQHQSFFTENQLIARVASKVSPLGVTAEAIRRHVQRHLRHTPEIQSLAVRKGQQQFTTEQIYDVEKKLLQLAEESRHQDQHVLDASVVQKVISRIRTLRAEQILALQDVTLRPGSIQCVSGMAGTGKTFMLKAARLAWEKQGYKVLGAALAARAARELEAGSGIKSSTLALTLLRLRHGSLAHSLAHHAAQLAKAALTSLNPAFDLSARRKHHLRLTSKTVLVIDEAGMLGTEQLCELLDHAARSGAKVVLVGDERQLQPIDAGGPFRRFVLKTLKERTTRLTEITRQSEPWMREAVADFAAGRSRDALSRFASHGRLVITPTRSCAIGALIENWNAHHQANPGRSSLIVAGTNDEVRELNQWAQGRRVEAGELLSARSVRIDDTRFYVGDRIVFTKNDYRAGVFNGDFGTIESISKGGLGHRGLFKNHLLTIRLEGPKADPTGYGPLGNALKKWWDRNTPTRVTIEVKNDDFMRLGYAVTTHKSQGATVDEVFALAGGWMLDRELAYVQFSRSKGATWVYADESTAGEDLTEMTRAMERSRQKEMAHDVQRQQEL
jgi:conjugative relaxase-like TrwC/TraI family protein